MIKYINMQTALCARCKADKVITRCNKEHLERIHGYRIDSIHEVVEKVSSFVKDDRKKKRKQKDVKIPYLKRKEIMEFADSLIQTNMRKIKICLDT